MTDAHAIDLAKTLAQLMVTALIAWFTVRAALARFKAERTWERRLESYVSLLTRLGDLQTIIGRWLDRAEDQPMLDQLTHSERFEEGRRKFEPLLPWHVFFCRGQRQLQ